MEIVNILPEGIRRISGEQESGAASCDNMLNLRHEYRSLKVVGDKSIISANSYYDKIYEHRLPNRVNMIGVYKDSNDVTHIDNITSGVEIYSFQPVEYDIDIVFMNNLMVVKVYDSDIYSYSYRLMSFIWKDSSYSVFYNGVLPDTPAYEIELTTVVGEQDKDILLFAKIENNLEFYDYVMSLYNQLAYEDKNNLTQGSVLVSVNFTLFDGTQTKPSPPRLFKLGNVDGEEICRVHYSLLGLSMYLTVSKVMFTLNIDDDFYEKNKDIIKSVNVYSTRPKSYFDFEKTIKGSMYDGVIDSRLSSIASGSVGSIVLSNTVDFNDDGNSATIPLYEDDGDSFADEIFYLQKSIPLTRDVDNMNKSIEFFFDSTLMAQPLMNVDTSGYFRYYGDMLVYNNRLHLYNLRREFMCGASLLDWGRNGNSVSVTAVVYIRTEVKDLKYIFSFETYLDAINTMVCVKDFISFPDSRAYKVEFYYNRYIATAALKPSRTGNFAYRYNIGGAGDTLEINTGTTPGLYDIDLEIYDRDTLVVSSQSNPIYFDNSNAYRIDGNITSLSVLTDGVSELQIGQFPIAIFSDNGIYVLSQGDKEVLYSNITKISTIRSIYPTIQTKMGIFFVADGSIYHLSGRTITRVSDLVEGEPDKDIVNSANYTLCCQNNQTYSVPLLPNIKEYCSDGVILSYDDTEDELFISNIDISPLSFVYNIKTKDWHSVDFTVLFSRGKYAIAVKNNYKSIIDLNTEVFSQDKNNAQLVHLQTRASTFGSYDYKTIHRLITRCDATINEYIANNANKGLLSVYLFGSNDIKSWYLIGASQYENYTDKLQIQKVANNYKYFTIVIGGYIKEHSTINSTQVMFDKKFNNKLR